MTSTPSTRLTDGFICAQALRRGVEDLLGDLGLAFVGGGVGVVRVEVEALDAYFEALALRQTRDSLIRASLVRHAALPGGAALLVGTTGDAALQPGAAAAAGAELETGTAAPATPGLGLR